MQNIKYCKTKYERSRLQIEILLFRFDNLLILQKISVSVKASVLNRNTTWLKNLVSHAFHEHFYSPCILAILLFYNCQKFLGRVGERAARGCIRRDASLRISTLGCTRRYHCWTFPVVSLYFRSAAGCFPGVSTLSANFSPRGTSNRNNMTIVTRIPTRQSGTDADISATLSHRCKMLLVGKESHWGDFDGIYTSYISIVIQADTIYF